MGKQIRYTTDFKIQTVQIYLQGDVSATQLSTDLGIHPHTVRHWIRDYNDGKIMTAQPLNCKGTEITSPPLRIQPECTKRSDIGIIISKINTLESELKELKSALQAYLFL